MSTDCGLTSGGDKRDRTGVVWMVKRIKKQPVSTDCGLTSGGDKRDRTAVVWMVKRMKKAVREYGLRINKWWR